MDSFIYALVLVPALQDLLPRDCDTLAEARGNKCLAAAGRNGPAAFLDLTGAGNDPEQTGGYRQAVYNPSLRIEPNNKNTMRIATVRLGVHRLIFLTL
jgi:hypothetical protein